MLLMAEEPQRSLEGSMRSRNRVPSRPRAQINYLATGPCSWGLMTRIWRCVIPMCLGLILMRLRTHLLFIYLFIHLLLISDFSFYFYSSLSIETNLCSHFTPRATISYFPLQMRGEPQPASQRRRLNTPKHSPA